jgi:hypothetical protein
MLDVHAPPTAVDVERLDHALRTLEERHTWGPAGLLTCLGWGADWFERRTRLPSPVARPLPMAAWEDPVLADGYTNAVFRLLAALDVPRKGLVGP